MKLKLLLLSFFLFNSSIALAQQQLTCNFESWKNTGYSVIPESWQSTDNIALKR